MSEPGEPAISDTGAVSRAEGLTPTELRVVDFLLRDWEKRYRVTTIDQALRALGYPGSSDMRLRIGSYLAAAREQTPELSQRLEEWGARPFILTNLEKLVARCILFRVGSSGKFPSEARIARDLRLNTEQVVGSLEVLAKAGFLDARADRRQPYALSAGSAAFLEGLGLTSHTVIRENGEEFNVQCAADALMLAAADYAAEEVLIQDCCYHCVQQLALRTRGGRVISQEPPGIRLYEGDG